MCYHAFMWILYVCIYGCLIGFYTVFRKQALKQSGLLFTLALFSVFGFFLVSWKAADAVTISWQYILLILLRAFIITTVWILELYAMREYYLSILQPISAIKVIIGFCLSAIIFSEPVFWNQIVGVLIVVFGIAFLRNGEKKNLYLARRPEFQKKEKKIITYYVLSCILSEMSALIDKFSLQTINSNQMQWWFMLFSALILVLYFVIMCIKKKKILCNKSDWMNIFIYGSAAIMIVADTFLFNALMDVNSKASVIAILKQLSIVVSVIFGGLMFKEKGLKKSLYYLAIIMIGIVIILI